MTSKIPKMFVFDLDGCVWEPEMYEIWGGGSPFKTQKNGNVKDCKGQEVYFLGDVRKILYELHTDSKYADSIVGVASTCDEPSWAAECLQKMRIGPNLDIKPDDVFAHKEIYKARSKEVHFRTLAEKTGISLDEMVFYDNQMNNMNAVSRLPVTCIYTPDGVTRELFEKSLKVFPAPGKIIK